MLRSLFSSVLPRFLLQRTHYLRTSKHKRDLYGTLSAESEILGIDRDSDINTIKKAYYKLAQQYHPDKNKAQDAKERFAEISK